jgi:hypothetical protein
LRRDDVTDNIPKLVNVRVNITDPLIPGGVSSTQAPAAEPVDTRRV